MLLTQQGGNFPSLHEPFFILITMCVEYVNYFNFIAYFAKKEITSVLVITHRSLIGNWIY
jgi:hypothetical protein